MIENPLADPQGRKQGLEVLRHRWIILIPLFFMWFFGQADKTNISVIIPDNNFIRELHFLPHSAALGALMTYFLVGYGISTIIWGFIIDWLPSRIIAVAAALMWGMGLVWFGVGNSHLSLYLSRFYLGLAEGALYPLANSLVAEWFPFRERGKATSIWFCGVGSGPAIATPLFALAVSNIGWRMSFISLGIFEVVFLCPLCFLTIRNVHARGPRTQGRGVEPAEGTDELPEIGQRIYKAGGGSPLFFVRSSVYWANVLCNVANGLAMWGSTTWLLAYLTQVRKYTLIQSGLFVGLGFLLDVCITLYVGIRSDRRQRRAPYGIFLYIVVLVAMGMSVWSPWPLLSALAVVVTIGILAAAPAVFQTLLHSYIPRPSMGRASGIMSFMNNSISSISPVIVGMLVGINNNWTAAFVWLMFWPLVALGVMVWFQRLRL